jgi:hypothetical protein
VEVGYFLWFSTISIGKFLVYRNSQLKFSAFEKKKSHSKGWREK